VDPEFQDALGQADIFSFETVGWARDTLVLNQRLADGEQEALDTLDRETHGHQKEFFHQLHRAMFGTQVTVHHPDVPQGHALVAQSRQAEERAQIMSTLMLTSGLSVGIPQEKLEQVTTPLFSMYSKRERYMIEHFFPKEMPDKPDKEEPVRIVGFFGALHKAMAIILARAAAKQDRTDIQISVNDFEIPLSPAYDDFLHQRPALTDKLVAFLTTPMN
jgi:hypothetical protein